MAVKIPASDSIEPLSPLENFSERNIMYAAFRCTQIEGCNSFCLNSGNYELSSHVIEPFTCIKKDTPLKDCWTNKGEDST